MIGVVRHAAGQLSRRGRDVKRATVVRRRRYER